MSKEKQKDTKTPKVKTRMGRQERGTKNRASAEDIKVIVTPEYQLKHNHLLVIAVDRYDDKGIPDLNNCLNDIEDLLEILTTHYFFTRDNIRFLRSRVATSNTEKEEEEIQRENHFATTIGEATHDNIIAQLKELAKTMTPKDNLIICFSGHGIYDEDFDEGYWIPSDGRLDYNSSYVENGTIRTALNAMNTHHTVLISDSCYSGTLFSGGATRALTVPRIYNQPSRWGITAGRKEPVSDGALGDNSPFAKELLDILGKKREVWISDLVSEIIRRVTDENNEKQSPVGEALSFIKGHQNGQFVFFPRLAAEEDYWEMAWQENTRKGYYAFLARYPNGRYEDTALDALNVFALGENQKPAYSEEALSTYRLLQKYLPDEAKSYAGSFLNGETRSVLLADAREMYHDLMIHFPKHIERELKTFVLLGENVSNQEDLLRKYQKYKGDEEELKKKFSNAFVKRVKGNPYKGLEAYGERDSQLFFGRKTATNKIIDQLEAERLLIISAPAYAGKTSLVRAGIHPALKDKYEECELVIAGAGAHPSSYQHYDRVLKSRNKERKKLLFIDDWERLFSNEVSEKERLGLQERIVKLLKEDETNWLVVICLQSDFEKQLRASELSTTLPLDKHLYRLPALSSKELRKVLLGPMWSTSTEFESPELIDTIIRDVEHVPNMLPLLSLTLRELYERALNDSKVIKKEVYGVKVSVHSAIDAIADRFFYKDDEKLRILKKVFLRMVEPLGNGQYRAKAIRDYDFTHFNEDENDLIKRFVGSLGDNDLVRVIYDESSPAGVEPKDLLITNWSRLQEWIKEFGQENIVLQRELSAASRKKHLWDKDPRLNQVLTQILSESIALIKSNEPYLMELLQVIAEDLDGQDQTDFSAFIENCKYKDVLELDDVILTGASYQLLEALLSTSTHWLNYGESEFVLKSWDKKVQALMELKRERDEALVVEKKAVVAQKRTEELLRKSILQTQAFKVKYQEQNYKDLLFMQQGFKPNLHLILIGINEYPGVSRLKGCVEDVKAIVTAFSAQEGKLYNKVISHVLTDKDATKENILRHITKVKESANIFDFVFIYLAGHGLQINPTKSNTLKQKDGGFITYTAEYEKGDDLNDFVYLKDESLNLGEGTVILSGQEFCTALMVFKCKVILTLDISYGGDFLSTLISANHSDKPADLSHYVFALSGTSANEMSKETYVDGKPRGVFSYAFTNSITTNDADLDSNGVLYLDELLRYTSKIVKENAKDQNVLAVVPPIMTNIPLFQLGDDFALPKAELVLSGHITDDAVIKSVNTIFGIEEDEN